MEESSVLSGINLQRKRIGTILVFDYYDEIYVEICSNMMMKCNDEIWWWDLIHALQGV